jgi:hypothetical protein
MNQAGGALSAIGATFICFRRFLFFGLFVISARDAEKGDRL